MLNVQRRLSVQRVAAASYARARTWWNASEPPSGSGSTVSRVDWRTYERWEGPVVIGDCPYRLPLNPNPMEKVFWVTAAAEGYLDSVQAFDRGIVSAGALQWIEGGGLFHVSQMLGLVQHRSHEAMRPLMPIMQHCGVALDSSLPGVYRFRFGGGTWVDNVDRLQDMYFGGASGLKGGWTAETKQVVEAWVTGISGVFKHPAAQELQVGYTLPRLMTFVRDGAKTILWDSDANDDSGVRGAARAAYISFAVNNPAAALRALVTMQTEHPRWSYDWLRALLQALTFTAGIPLYVHRYNAIRQRLEKLYGVNLPDFADGLSDAPLASVKSIQDTLRALGFDPGPSDGDYGRRTETALRGYQKSRGLKPDGMLGPVTRARLLEDLKAIDVA